MLEPRVPSPSSARLRVEYPLGYDPQQRRQSIYSESTEQIEARLITCKFILVTSIG